MSEPIFHLPSWDQLTEAFSISGLESVFGGDGSLTSLNAQNAFTGNFSDEQAAQIAKATAAPDATQSEIDAAAAWLIKARNNGKFGSQGGISIINPFGTGGFAGLLEILIFSVIGFFVLFLLIEAVK